eukprot:TRINITY_DN1367_c0_g1_i16.p1 TRINITY_DN1367_c0_g1~~TRINITY_DN1367_c0_g1_i16.p1  ORF type:complete len:380 (+),score=73.30 TRINITY_DN1367_c0_g1_i16:204-1343(+)
MTSKSIVSALLAIPYYPNDEPLFPELDVLPDLVSSRKFADYLLVSEKNSAPQTAETSSAETSPELKPVPKDVVIAALYHKKLSVDLELSGKFAFNVFRNQLVFVLTTLLSVTTAVLFFVSPDNLFPKWYVFAVVLMFTCRITDYVQKKEHFFLIDFCYTAGLQILFFLVLRPQSVHLATRTFAFGAGVLGWSTVLFSNGLAVHRLDEFCSLWIHTVPSLLAYTLRWTNENSLIYYKNPGFDFSSDHVVQYYIACYAPYFVWATGYYLIIAKAFKSLTIDGEYRTLVRFIVEKSSGLRKLMDIFGSKNRTETFMFFHCLFFTLTTVVGYVCFFHRTLHTVCIVVQIFSLVFHGGKILAEDIATPYLTRLQRINSLLTSLG